MSVENNTTSRQLPQFGPTMNQPVHICMQKRAVRRIWHCLFYFQIPAGLQIPGRPPSRRPDANRPDRGTKTCPALVTPFRTLPERSARRRRSTPHFASNQPKSVYSRSRRHRHGRTIPTGFRVLCRGFRPEASKPEKLSGVQEGCDRYAQKVGTRQKPEHQTIAH